MYLYHRTSAAGVKDILQDGFLDTTGYFLRGHAFRGVWFSDDPFTPGERTVGDTVLCLDIPEPIIAEYEWKDAWTPYREWLIPAALLNAYFVLELYEDAL